MVVSITGMSMSMGGVFLGCVGVFRQYPGRCQKGVGVEGRPRVYSVGQSVIPIRTLPSPSTQVSCV
jgi:hypothetical protein